MRKPRMFDAPSASDYDRPSKSQVKREALGLQDLGDELLELPAATLDALVADERLREALEELRRLRDHSARKRQRQYVGKLLGHEDLEPLRAAIAQRRAGQSADKRALQQVEQWRERLLSEPAALDDWLAQHPASDTPAFRALLRDAQREHARQEKGRAFRELFKRLRADMSTDPTA